MIAGKLLLPLLAVCCVACAHSDSILPPDSTKLSIGTWGGDDAGVIVEDSVTHIHIDCTFGNFTAPIPLDATRRFSVAGSYVLRAYPVQLGPELPAQFAGVVEHDRLTFTVAVNDTVEKKVVALGPITVRYGQPAVMGPCPICRRGTIVAPAGRARDSGRTSR
jgi:hypothetical protein